MVLYTMDRGFKKVDVIDKLNHAIWTERYYGDDEFELYVPPTLEMIQKLKPGVFIGLEGSSHPMMLENIDIEGDVFKATGIGLLPWMNNRFVRVSPLHTAKEWVFSGATAGVSLWWIIYYMCIGGPYLDGTIPTGIPNPWRFIVPGLGLLNYDNSGPGIAVSVPYGPVYDAMRAIATTYQIGMEIVITSVTDAAYSLGFRSYAGLDRRSDNKAGNASVRFGPQMDSLANIKELQSISDYKNLVYSFCSTDLTIEDVNITPDGLQGYAGPGGVGFDLRAMLTFEDDFTAEQVGTTSMLLSLLSGRASKAVTDHRVARVVDGEIVPTHQYQFGKDYNLGDLIEVQGNSGIVQGARVTEYIRTQDNTGEKSYPTVELLD